MSNNTWIGFLSSMFALAATPTLHATASVITKEMVGRWQGSARIVVDWCQQQELAISVVIHADGTVTGTVGDAELVRGRLTSNRGWVERALNWATDYIVKGDLRGPVVAAEGISRSAVSMPLDFANGCFMGGVHTSGSKFGGKDRMILSARSLRLVKQD